MDIQGRDDRERQLAGMIELVFRDQRRALGGDMRGQWQRFEGLLRVMLEQSMEETFIDCGTALWESATKEMAPRDARWLRTAAKQWAHQTAVHYSRLIGSHTRVKLREFLEQDLTKVELADKISKLLGSARAKRIAVTEITRASTEGENTARRRLESTGKIRFVMRWFTMLDERVCPICGPLHGKDKRSWRHVAASGPPAHVHCRCWLNYTIHVPGYMSDTGRPKTVDLEPPTQPVDKF